MVEDLRLISALALGSDPAEITEIEPEVANAPNFNRIGPADLIPSRFDDLLALLAGEDRIETSAWLAAGTRLAPASVLFLVSLGCGESLGIRLDLRLAFSSLNGPIIDLRLPPLLAAPARGVEGPRRAGLP